MALFAIAAIACGSSSPSNPSGPSNDAGPSDAGAPYIYSTILTTEDGNIPPYFGFLEEVQVCTDGIQCSSPVSNATVTVNGGPLTYHSDVQAYFGEFLIAAGAPVTLQVTIGTTVYSASGTQFTTAPTVTAPDAGVTWQASSANNISWTGGAPTAGAVYFAQISALTGQFNEVFPADGGTPEVPITTTSVTVPAGTLPAPATNFYLLVGIATPGFYLQDTGGIAIPDAGAGSGLWLGLLAPYQTLNTQ